MMKEGLKEDSVKCSHGKIQWEEWHSWPLMPHALFSLKLWVPWLCTQIVQNEWDSLWLWLTQSQEIKTGNKESLDMDHFLDSLSNWWWVGYRGKLENAFHRCFQVLLCITPQGPDKLKSVPYHLCTTYGQQSLHGKCFVTMKMKQHDLSFNACTCCL